MKFDMYVKNIKNMYSINFQISCPTKKKNINSARVRKRKKLWESFLYYNSHHVCVYDCHVSI